MISNLCSVLFILVLKLFSMLSVAMKWSFIFKIFLGGTPKPPSCGGVAARRHMDGAT